MTEDELNQAIKLARGAWSVGNRSYRELGDGMLEVTVLKPDYKPYWILKVPDLHHEKNKTKTPSKKLKPKPDWAEAEIVCG